MNNRKNISFKFIFTVFGIVTAVITATRLYQLFAITEENGTGFFKTVNVSVFCLYIAAAVSCILLLGLVTFSNRVTASKSYRGKNKALCITSAIFAAGLAVDISISVSKFIFGVKAAPTGEQLGYLFSNGYLAYLFEAVFGLFACIYFILYSLSYGDGRSVFREYKLMALCPLFWSMSRMVGRFMTKISFTVVADLLLELIMLAFMMLFFISFARISVQLCQKNEMRKAMSCGLVAAAFAIAIGLSRLVVTVIGKTELLPKQFDVSLNLADLAFGAFAVAYVYASSKTGRDASEDEALEYEEAEQDGTQTDDDFLND